MIDPMPTEGEIRAAARAIYERYDEMGAGYTASWGTIPELEKKRYIELAKAALDGAELHRLGKLNG
jgi:hypothetical protein